MGSLGIIFFSIVRLSVLLWSAIFSYVGLTQVSCVGLEGSPQSVVVWKMVLSYLSWCLWREIDYRNFEDRERTMVELKSFFFKTPLLLDNCSRS